MSLTAMRSRPGQVGRQILRYVFDAAHNKPSGPTEWRPQPNEAVPIKRDGRGRRTADHARPPVGNAALTGLLKK